MFERAFEGEVFGEALLTGSAQVTRLAEDKLPAFLKIPIVIGFARGLPEAVGELEGELRGDRVRVT